MTYVATSKRLPAPGSPTGGDYIAGGSEDESTLRANVAAWAQLELWPTCCATCRRSPPPPPFSAGRWRPHGGVAHRDARLFHAEGELATARATAHADTIYVCHGRHHLAGGRGGRNPRRTRLAPDLHADRPGPHPVTVPACRRRGYERCASRGRPGRGPDAPVRRWHLLRPAGPPLAQSRRRRAGRDDRELESWSPASTLRHLRRPGCLPGVERTPRRGQGRHSR